MINIIVLGKKIGIGKYLNQQVTLTKKSETEIGAPLLFIVFSSLM